MTGVDLLEVAHGNLALWARVYAEHNGARTATDAGLLLASLPFRYPGFRSGMVVGPIDAGSVPAARAFFADDPDAFVLFAREEDLPTLEGPGVAELFRPPQMVCTERVDEPAPDADTTLRLATHPDDVRAYAEVAGQAFTELSFPADETTASLNRPSLLDDERVAIGIAERNGRVMAGAMSVTEGDGSYISYVAATAEARRHGLGDAVTRLVTNTGFDRGATVASLEASHFGYRVYERMGYREIRQYRLLVVTPVSP